LTEGERGRLVEAMARSCAEKGYLETTVEDVAAEAGLSEAEFHRHFPGKEDCAVAAVEMSLQLGLGAVLGGYSADLSERESAVRSLKLLLEVFEQRPPVAFLAMTGSRQMMPGSSLHHYKSGFSILAATLDRLRSDQMVDLAVPPRAARAAIGGAEALVRREIDRGAVGEVSQVLPSIVFMAVVSFLGQEEALRLSRFAETMLSEELPR
jgi:AcrR family transcriptional regulator